MNTPPTSPRPKTRTITEGELVALEADGWVETLSIDSAAGRWICLRRGDERRFETVVEEAL
ncbi:MAG: hypothetical protein KIT22_19565 [Verrucomicrobiae bacterium]|nr:hypothetical protein [Verrucomicrobiae bacterium]